MPVTSDGWDIEALEASAGRDPFAIAYLMPDFQNPSGQLMDAGARRRVLRVLERAGTHTLIDETFVELDLDAVAMPPPAAASGGERTITIGSLSKAVWGGLRIGWVRADPLLVRRLAAARASLDMASPVFEQIVATKVFESLDQIMEERLATIRLRRDALTAALDRELPDWSYSVPAGGMFLWTTLPAPVSTSLSIQASERDVLITPGPRFAAPGLLERYIRIPFTLPPDQLELAVSILADLSPTGAGRAAPDSAAYVA